MDEIETPPDEPLSPPNDESAVRDRPDTAEPLGSEVSASPPDLTLDVIFEVLSNKRRRSVLAYLDEHDGTVDIGELAEHLAEQEYDTPTSGPTSSQRKRMYVSLYQHHLPKMNDMDIVDFDENRGHIETGPRTSHVRRILDRVTADDPPWPAFYVGLAALAGTLYGLMLLWPASTPLSTIALGVILVLLGVTGLVHGYYTR